MYILESPANMTSVIVCSLKHPYFFYQKTGLAPSSQIFITVMLSNQQPLVFVLCLALCVNGNGAGTLAGLEIKQAKSCGEIN